MGIKSTSIVALVFIVIIANALAQEENEKASKPTPKFIRKLFQKLFETNGEFRQKREAEKPEHKGKNERKK